MKATVTFGSGEEPAPGLTAIGSDKERLRQRVESTQGETGTQQSPINGRFKTSIQLLQLQCVCVGVGGLSPPGTALGTWEGQK